MKKLRNLFLTLWIVSFGYIIFKTQDILIYIMLLCFSISLIGFVIEDIFIKIKPEIRELINELIDYKTKYKAQLNIKKKK